MKDAGRNVVKDDRVRSRLVERQSFHLSNSQIDPMYCVLMYFPVLLVNCNSGSRHVAFLLLVHVSKHGINSLQCRINFTSSILALNRSKVENTLARVGIQAVLEPLLDYSSSLQVVWPSTN